jgi:hypothetical protein
LENRQTDFIKDFSHRPSPSTSIPRIVPEFTFKKIFAGKNRSVPAYPEPGRVDATRTADPTTALHIPVEAEFPALFKPLLAKADENR